MATKHSLICWGGHLGKTVSISATTDLVTLTNHGLRNGKKLWPSGTLPAELSVLVPVYARRTATNTFSLHPTSADAIADTNKILFAGSSTYSAVVFKAEAIANPASYFAFAGLSDLSRWYDDDLDVYRIYDGRVSWNTARAAASTVFDTEVVEFGDDFDDIVAASFSLTIPCAAVVMTSLVNGVRGAGWHNMTKGAGYAAVAPNGGYTALFPGNLQDVTFDGFSCTVLSTSASGTALATSSRGGNVVKNMILSGISTSFGYGISFQGAMTKLQNCLITGLLRGIATGSFTYGALIANNTVVGNGTGIYAEGSGASTYGKWYNNAVFGNTTNWSRAAPAAVEAASHNTGESGDAIATWEVGAGATSFDITSAAFANYAGGDFRPASASSLLVDAGTDYYGRLAYDLGDNEVPNYNNGGAEGIDIGCFEFDHEYGNHPASHVLTLTNVVVGSRVLVRDQADTTTHYDQIAADSTVEITVTVYGDTRDNWRIKIRKASAAPFYQPFETLMTATAGSSSLYVNQLPD